LLADPEAPGQSVLEAGLRVPAGTSQRLACDATRERLDVGYAIDGLHPLAVSAGSR
jgi:hypothetical protein